MRRFVLVLMVAGMTLVGCAALDWAAGVDEKGVDKPGPAPIQTAAPFADMFLPGAGVALTGLAGLWAAARGRAWRKVAQSTFDVVEDFGNLNIDELKTKLAAAHDKEGVLKLARQLVDRYGHG